jgi:hypothetical protein
MGAALHDPANLDLIVTIGAVFVLAWMAFAFFGGIWLGARWLRRALVALKVIPPPSPDSNARHAASMQSDPKTGEPLAAGSESR